MPTKEKISVSEYFFKTYKKKLSHENQPMLVIKMQGNSIKIPSEFCLIDGVPEQIRNSKNDKRKLF